MPEIEYSSKDVDRPRMFDSNKAILRPTWPCQGRRGTPIAAIKQSLHTAPANSIRASISC